MTLTIPRPPDQTRHKPGVDRPTQAHVLHEIAQAKRRIYRLAGPTPLELLAHPSGATFHIKREDLSPIHSYKWRGAMNRLSVLREAGVAQEVVCASAGNHGQGVALAACTLQMRARVFMPKSSPQLKIRQTRKFLGERGEVILCGDSVDEALAAAQDHASTFGSVLIPPFEDLHVIAGQGTIGEEIIQSRVHPQTVYLQIGGGGMAAGVACAIKSAIPGAHIIGVEGEGQASMRSAVHAGRPVTLDEVDTFCDGTAVGTVGRQTHALCADLIDEFVTVSNNEVCAAIGYLWNERRIIPEPSGALGMAALLKETDARKIRDSVVVLSGANMDFSLLSWISRHAELGSSSREYFRVEMPERMGGLAYFLDMLGDSVNIIDFQYGKTSQERAAPTLGFAITSAELANLQERLRQGGIAFSRVTGQESVDYRVIPLRPDLLTHPLFLRIDFPERAGALHEFLHHVRDVANICYFNYETTGETQGHALMGFEFSSLVDRSEFQNRVKESGYLYHVVSLPIFEP